MYTCAHTWVCVYVYIQMSDSLATREFNPHFRLKSTVVPSCLSLRSNTGDVEERRFSLVHSFRSFRAGHLALLLWACAGTVYCRESVQPRSLVHLLVSEKQREAT